MIGSGLSGGGRESRAVDERLVETDGWLCTAGSNSGHNMLGEASGLTARSSEPMQHQ